MKNLLILMLVVLGAAMLTACSKDDDNKSTPVEKQVSKITGYEDGVYEFYYTYDYDNQGRVIRTTYYEDDDMVSTETFTYTDNKIIYTDGYSSQHTVVYNLNSKGVIISSDAGEQYIYNDNNQLVKIKWDSDEYKTFTWKDGNVIQEVRHYNGEDHIITYTFTKDEDYTKCMCPFEKQPNDVLFDHGYFGAKNKNLILSKQSDWSEDSYTSEYEFDKDSYVTSEKRYYQVDKYTQTYVIEYK